MHNFNPRGIIKWSPFAALNEYQSTVELLSAELDRELNFRTSNYLEFIDETLVNCDLQDDILIKYYNQEDTLCSEFGPIEIVDSKTIKINNIKIQKQKIIDIII